MEAKEAFKKSLEGKKYTLPKIMDIIREEADLGNTSVSLSPQAEVPERVIKKLRSHGYFIVEAGTISISWDTVKSDNIASDLG